MSNASIRDTFFEECEELLEALSEGLSIIEAGDHDAETVNAVFRAVHSIKGGAGAFGLNTLVEFAHKFETVLDALRSDKLLVTGDIIRVLLRAADHLCDQVDAALARTEADEITKTAILAELAQLLSENPDSATPDADQSFEFEPLGIEIDPTVADDALAGFEINFAADKTLYANGHDPRILFNALRELGQLKVVADLTSVPPLDDLDPSDAHINWHLQLLTSEPEGDILAIFEFVEDLCTLNITPITATRETQAPEPDATDNTAIAQAPKAEAKAPRPTLRVDLDRIDRLINTVGELIINQAMIAQKIDDIGLASSSDILTNLEAYKLLAREIQEGVMAIRAQPVKPLFQRMSRIVREASEATAKSARFVTVGEDTEVDKTVVERLADPLTHMIRNAIDHGLEAPEDRRAASKDETGTIKLSAAHKSGSVLIEISDDGAGLNRKKIKEIAIAKNLIPENADLSDAEIDNLLFLPGFSTAQEVSDLSGRGVGMDVVKNAVTALGGRVSIMSTPGRGTVFSVVLPLTLAVMDGMVVDVAGQTMVVPIASILETIRPSEKDLHHIGRGGRLVFIRGKYIPIVDIAESFGQSHMVSRDTPQVLLLVETEGQAQRALAVDGISDQRQVVIKGLDKNYGKIPGVSAATILGNGEIALIIDPDALAQCADIPETFMMNTTNKMEITHEAG